MKNDTTGNSGASSVLSIDGFGELCPGSGGTVLSPQSCPDEFRLRLQDKVNSGKKRHHGTTALSPLRSAVLRQEQPTVVVGTGQGCEVSDSTWEPEEEMFAPRCDDFKKSWGRKNNRADGFSSSTPLERVDPMHQIEDYSSFASFLAPFSITHIILPGYLNEKLLGVGLTFRVSECSLPAESFRMEKALEDRASKDLVALKRVKASEFLRGSSQQHIMQEVCLELRALLHPPLREHPNIVDLIGVGWEMTMSECGVKVPSPLLIVEHANYGTLQDHQNFENLSWQRKKTLASDIAMALQMLHECEIIHGDVKSENVLLFPHNERTLIAKLSDFGCSLFDDGPHGQKVNLGGTPLWAAPEVEDGPVSKSLAKLTDVYSFGLLLWRLCAEGRNPFTSSLMFNLEPDQENDELLHEIQTLKRSNSFMSICIEHGDFLESQCDIPLVRTMKGTLTLDPTLRKDMSSLVTYFEQGVRSGASERLFSGESIQRSPGLFECDFIGESPRDILDCMLLDDQYTQSRQRLPGGVTRGIVDGLLRIASSSQGERCLHCLQSTVIDRAPETVTFDDLLAMRDSLICTERDLTLIRAVEAAFELSYCFTVGYGVKNSRQQALHWLLFAASNGLRRAQAIVTPVFQSFGQPLPAEVPYRTWLYNGLIEGSIEASRCLQKITPTFHHVAREVFLRSTRGIGRSFWKDHNPQGTWPIDDASQLEKLILEIGRPINQVMANDVYEDRLIHLAVATDFPDSVRLLVEALGADINVTNSAGETPLLAACRSGRISTARYLIQKGADVKKATATGVTALHWLISFDDSDEQKEIALRLDDRGARLEATSKPQLMTYETPTRLYFCGSPLHWAITARNVKAFKVLVDLGADLECRNALGKTPLELAVAFQLRDIVELLLPALKPSRMPLLRTSIRQVSVFFHRAQFGSAWMEEMEGMIESLLGAISATEVRRSTGMVPEILEDAVRRWPVELVSVLLDKLTILLADLSEPSLMERPLALLIQQDDTVQFDHFLCKSISFFNLQASNASLMAAAASTNNPYFAQQLLARGADPFEKVKDGLDAFGIAVHASAFTTAQAILSCSNHKAQRHHFEANGPEILGHEYGPATLLGHLLSMHHIDKDPIVFLLGLEGNAADAVVLPKSRVTALHVVSMALGDFHSPVTAKRHRRVLSVALEHYSQQHHLNALDLQGQTPLHWAVNAVNFEAVNALLEANSDPKCRGETASTALDSAYAILNEIVLGDSAEYSVTRRFLRDRKAGKNLLEKRLDEIIELLKEYGGVSTTERQHGLALSKAVKGRPTFDEAVLNRNDFEALEKENDDVDAISFLSNTPLWEARMRRAFPQN